VCVKFHQNQNFQVREVPLWATSRCSCVAGVSVATLNNSARA